MIAAINCVLSSFSMEVCARLVVLLLALSTLFFFHTHKGEKGAASLKTHSRGKLATPVTHAKTPGPYRVRAHVKKVSIDQRGLICLLFVSSTDEIPRQAELHFKRKRRTKNQALQKLPFHLVLGISHKFLSREEQKTHSGEERSVYLRNARVFFFLV